MLLQSVTAVM